VVKRSISNNLADSPPFTQKRCGLLVSVRCPEEAQLALGYAIDVLDLKEPRAGALGAVSEAIVEKVVQLVEQVNLEQPPKLSLAMGELVDWDFERWPTLLDRYQSYPIGGFRFLKIGLAGAQQLSDWQADWSKLFAGLPESTQPVVVAYLDRLPEVLESFGASNDSGDRCPSIEQLIEFAQSQPRVSTILLDTWGKQGDLFASVSDRRLREIIAAANRAGLAVAVAGSVKIDSLQRVSQAGASMVGVRGAVCAGDRSGQLCEQKLREFCQRMKEVNP